MRFLQLCTSITALMLAAACGPATNAPAANTAAANTPAAAAPRAPSNNALPVTGRPAANAPGENPVVGVLHFSCEEGRGEATLLAMFDFGPDSATMTVVRDGQSQAETWPMDASGHVEGSRGPRRQDPHWIGDFRAAPAPQRAVGEGVYTFGMDFSMGGQHAESNVSMCTIRWTLGTAAQRRGEPG